MLLVAEAGAAAGAAEGVRGKEMPAPNPGLLPGVDDPDTGPEADANVPNMLLESCEF